MKYIFLTAILTLISFPSFSANGVVIEIEGDLVFDTDGRNTFDYVSLNPLCMKIRSEYPLPDFASKTVPLKVTEKRVSIPRLSNQFCLWKFDIGSVYTKNYRGAIGNLYFKHKTGAGNTKTIKCEEKNTESGLWIYCNDPITFDFYSKGPKKVIVEMVE